MRTIGSEQLRQLIDEDLPKPVKRERARMRWGERPLRENNRNTATEEINHEAVNHFVVSNTTPNCLPI